MLALFGYFWDVSQWAGLPGFTEVRDIYLIRFRISKNLNGSWVPNPSGEEGQALVVAQNDQDAVAKIQSAFGHDGVTTNVRCQGGVERIMQNVIVAI